MTAAIVAVAVLWAPTANAQEAPPAPADTAADPSPPADPAPPPDPVVDPPAAEAPPADPEPAPPPAPEPPAAEPAPDPTPPAAEDPQAGTGPSATRDETVVERTDPAPQRDSFTVTGTTTSSEPTVAVPAADDFLGPAAQVPATTGAESWIWTAEGDAFIDAFAVAGSGGTPGGPSVGLGAVLLNSPAGAAVKLEAAQRRSNKAAEATAIGSSAPPGAPGSDSNSFFSLFSGGSGGGGAVLLWFLLGIIAVWRLVPPDLTKTFLSPMATWRPSAYIPPIQHPG